jgi:phosphatidylserine/phosphatidylglycerophosphate/cardiolipin synthase-like enzyme
MKREMGKATKAKKLMGVGSVLLIGGGLSMLTGSHYVVILGTLLFLLGVVMLFEGGIRLKFFEELSTEEEILARLKEMIYSARRNILITTGSLNARAYKYDRVNELIKKKVKEGVDIQIICGGNINSKSLQEFSDLLLTHPNFAIYLTTENPYPHGMLIDDKSRLRLETYHSPHERVRLNTYFKNPGVAALNFKRDFEKYKQHSEKLTFEKAQKIIKKSSAEDL